MSIPQVLKTCFVMERCVRIETQITRGESMKRKSVVMAIILTGLFGPLGLIYVSWGQAVLGVVLWLLVVPSTIAVSPESAGTVSLAFSAVCVLVGWSMSREHNKAIDAAKADAERKHREVLAALEHAAQR